MDNRNFFGGMGGMGAEAYQGSGEPGQAVAQEPGMLSRIVSSVSGTIGAGTAKALAGGIVASAISKIADKGKKASTTAKPVAKKPTAPKKPTTALAPTAGGLPSWVLPVAGVVAILVVGGIWFARRSKRR